ncbi:MAG: LPS export ABC transporter permease LptF [Pseudomonadota bacterium]
MGRYDRYILSQLLVLFAFFSLVLISVYWINRAIDLFDTLLSDGQNIRVFLEFSALSLPGIMLNVLPVSAFVATLYVFNRMISESELVVLQTSGLSPLRLLRPVILFSLTLATLIALAAHIFSPAARTQFNDRSSQVTQDVAGRILQAGQFLYPTEGLTVFIREITELGEFRDLFLQDRSRETETTYTARRALLVQGASGPRLVMFDGMAQSLDEGRLSIVEFDDFTYDLGQLIAPLEARRRDIRELPTRVLLGADNATAELFGADALEMRYEGHQRIVRMLYAALIPMIGAAALMLGTFSRFGVWPQVLLAVGLILPLQVIANGTESLAQTSPAHLPLAYLHPALALVFVAGLLAAGRRRLLPGRGARATAEGAAT